MKYLILTASLLLGTAMLPMQALADNTQVQSQTHEQEKIHAPTNRVGAVLPTMKSGEEPEQTGSKTIGPSEIENDATAAANAPNKQEGIHPPTNRVGIAVPDMTEPDHDSKRQQ